MVTGISFSVDPDVPISSMVVVPVGARRDALQVRVAVPLPLAGTVTGFAVVVAETPLGNALTLNSTDPLNPPTLVMVRVVDVLPLSSIVNDEGDRDMVKFFVAEEFTVSEMVVLSVSDPEVPVMVMVAAPVVAVDDAVSVSVEVALPPDAGVTGLVENEAVTPLGKPDALSVVAESNPF